MQSHFQKANGKMTISWSRSWATGSRRPWKTWAPGLGVVVEHPSKRGINNAGTEKGEGWKVMNKCKNMKKKLKSWHKNVPKKSQKKKE